MPPLGEKKLAALMFTDLVGSVALQQRLGTAAYMGFVARHDEIFQEVLGGSPGAQVLNETGDGFLVRFDDPADALNAALGLQWRLHVEECQGERMRIRIGLHQGVVTEMQERIRGGTTSGRNADQSDSPGHGSGGRRADPHDAGLP